MTRCWINTISLEHVQRAVQGGFTQAGHGKIAPLRQLGQGDRLAFYSPRTAMGSGEPLQQFTALGTVTGKEPYQVDAGPDFHPWRLAMAFEPVTAAPIRPLIAQLAFIPDPQRWGFPFRRGLFEIDASDMEVVAGAMRAS